ncbi:hypothetical protein MD484_g5445, partial [Candolleomyces efflorescens]
MPEIAVGAQVFDVVFHPNRPIVYTGLLTGHIKAFSYDDQGSPQSLFSLRPSKRSCRGLSINGDGSRLYAVGKSKALSVVDTATQSIDIRSGAHDCAINRVKSLTSWMVATGDDDGTVKLWDPRQREAAKTYTQHFDYISDFLWLPDKKQLVSTSGDGTLSVMDIRAKKPEPIAHSEDQEDELLSIVAIKGHPLSVDALCNIPDVPGVDAPSTVLTGSSDGFVRAVQILPTKLLGVVADHGEFPVERVAVGEGVGQPDELGSDPSQRDMKVKPSVDADSEAESEEAISRVKRWWVGSVGHDDTLRMTDLEGFFRETAAEAMSKASLDSDEDSEEEWGGLSGGDDDDDDVRTFALAKVGTDGNVSGDEDGTKPEDREGEEDQEDAPHNKKRKRSEKDSLKKSKKGKKEEVPIDRSFFDGL